MKILTAIVEQPGERSCVHLADDLQLGIGAVRKEVRRLRRAGLVQPAVYRVLPYYKGGLAPAGLSAPTLGPEIRHALVEKTSEGEERTRLLTRRQLAKRLDVFERDGTFCRALKQLHELAVISTPADVWPTPAGVHFAKFGRMPKGVVNAV